MAILKEPTASRVFDTGDATPPRGTYVATCIDVKDMFGVQRPKFDNPSEMETLDVTAFLFGFRDRAGTPFKIASRTMRISGKENSNLFAFLKSWLGRAPQYGWDYCSLKGTQALITVDHNPSKKFPGRVFADIVSVSPVPEGFHAPTVYPTEEERRAAQPPAPPSPPPVSEPRNPPPPPPPPPVAPASVEDDDDPLPF